MKRSFKFSAAMFFILTTLLSGCVYPGDRWGHGGEHGGDRGDRGDRGDHGGDRGDHGDRR